MNIFMETFFPLLTVDSDINSERDLLLGKQRLVCLFLFHLLIKGKDLTLSFLGYCSPSTYNFSFYCSFIRFYNLLF